MKTQMQDNLLEGSSQVVTTASQQVAIRTGFLFLIVFAIVRPLLLMVESVDIAGLGLLDLMGVGISYFFLLPLIAGMRRLQLDGMAYLIFLFSLYVAESIMWGSEIRKVAQTILPFVLFFSVRMFITESKQIRVLSIALVLGFLIPITVSVFNIVLGRNIEMVEFWNQVPRHGGAFKGSHVLAYTMIFFTFLYCILRRVNESNHSFRRNVIGFFLILSVYCLYQSHTRTAIIGFIIFWTIYLWDNKKFFLGAIVLSIVAGILFHTQIYKLIFKKDQIDFNTATSGRVEIFLNNTQLFFNSSIAQQLLGRGVGHEARFPFHNDYIRLLMDLGIIGVALYLILLIKLLWDIYLCKDKKTKYLFGAILISVAAMNFGSNAVVFRIELSQYFWLIMGLFYCIENIRGGEYGPK